MARSTEKDITGFLEKSACGKAFSDFFIFFFVFDHCGRRSFLPFPLRTEKDIGSENPVTTRVSVHKDVFSYERLVATSVMEAAAFSLSVVDHGLDDSAIASISFMVARSTSPTPVK